MNDPLKQAKHNAVSVVELHHQVLRPWAEYRLTSGAPAPTVLTLDHHTDVVCAYRDPLRTVKDGEWRDPAQLDRVISELHHDEHFDWAIRSGLIDSCTIYAEVNGTVPANEKMSVRWDERWQDENHVFSDPEAYRVLADTVLEDNVLAARFGETLPDHFIQDIDCDFFATRKSLHPETGNYFRAMKERASLITISLERDWVRLLRFPGENMDSEEIVNTLFPNITTKTETNRRKESK